MTILRAMKVTVNFNGPEDPPYFAEVYGEIESDNYGVNTFRIERVTDYEGREMSLESGIDWLNAELRDENVEQHLAYLAKKSL